MASELRRRVLTAAVALPICIAPLWFGGWAASALISAASALACWEFLRLARARLGPPDVLAIGGAALLPWLPGWTPSSASVLALVVIAGLSFFAWTWHVVRQDVSGAASEAPLLTQALVFCALGPFFLAALRGAEHGREWVLAVIAATFANDTGAYAVGKLWGRHRVAPKVSPGKSWEGVAGGAVGSTVACAVAALVWPAALGLADAVVLAVVCSTLGPLGDLSKSALKRARGVKDAGALLPGHGGMLDRIDALLVNAPFFWAWVQWGR